ncbi:glycosyltransferase family 1 protein [Phenylobacterium sp.]|uniref:glycosyltransferase family 4 protein n=1 Tax=Phenylobacterium sp. TaxID=1871053 RepID=UPI0027368A0A|nr:glycosyltransferase family 1 protein [Phenylobacterium sp.]MDP3659124.1 glycosyltransferase family 1 protein [Phenylobacterium sp.]
MRIGVDATTWWNRRGFGRFTRLLLGAMLDAPRGHEFVLFVDRPPEPEMLRPGVKIVRVDTRRTVTEAAVADGSRSVGDLLAFRRAVAAERLDVMYYPAVYSWYPAGPRTPTVVTFHDAIAEHFSSLVFPSWRGRTMWGAKVWLAKTTARRITTVSQAAREEIATHMGIAKSRIAVFLEAADPRFQPVADLPARRTMRERLGLDADARLLLYVGGLAPHKNLLRLVEAYAVALDDPAAADLHLVLAGDPKGDGFHSNYEALLALVDSDPRLAARVRFTGYVPDEDLPALYSDALMVAMPALSEGFGLPAAEAIACGTPVIATAGGAVQEVVAGAGLFFDPLDVADMARVIVRCVSDEALMGGLRAAALPRAAELSWPRSAQGLIELLESIGARR